MNTLSSWMKRGAQILGETDAVTKVKLALTLVVAFWMIPLAYATDTDNGALIHACLMVYGLILWALVGFGVWWLL